MTPFAEHTDGLVTYESMVWYFMSTEAVVFAGGYLYKEIQNDIRTGQLTGQLCRPFSYYRMKSMEWMGRYVAQLLMLLPVGIVLAWTVTGSFIWSLHMVPLVLFSMLSNLRFELGPHLGVLLALVGRHLVDLLGRLQLRDVLVQRVHLKHQTKFTIC